MDFCTMEMILESQNWQDYISNGYVHPVFKWNLGSDRVIFGLGNPVRWCECNFFLARLILYVGTRDLLNCIQKSFWCISAIASPKWQSILQLFLLALSKYCFTNYWEKQEFYFHFYNILEFLGWIHLPLNKTLTEDTSFKGPINKTLVFFIRFWWNLVIGWKTIRFY